MDDSTKHVFPLDNLRQRLGSIGMVLFFAIFIVVGISELASPSSRKEGILMPFLAATVGGLMVWMTVLVMRRRQDARIEIEDETFRYFRSADQLEYEKELDYVYSLQTSQLWFQWKPGTYLIHFCDGRRFAFSSKMTHAHELIELLEQRTPHQFGPTNMGPTPEETTFYKMSDDELMEMASGISQRIEEASTKPKAFIEAEERFGKSLVGRWSEPGFGSSPLEMHVMVFHDGHAIVHWERIFGPTTHSVYEWRQTEPFVIETRQILGPDASDEWRVSRYEIDSFQLIENSRPEYGIRGFLFNSLFTYAGKMDPELTYESYIAEHPLLVDGDDEEED